ncbi:major facilitator superfamily domain-containing protein 6 [Candidatus Villigracilis affinis]|uniref:MFS transporter n=1 Tax=Candidatus Villigracilis affinis TaxID=3140682 RepID=UPI002A1F8031|nr:MFS transporter [Anaerolineales bacterium]
MKKIWPFSYYFIYFAGMAAFVPYIVLYYQTLGFSGTQIGLLVAISPLVSLVGGPLMTGLADSGNRHRLVMSLALGVAAVSMFMLPFLQAFLPVLILIVIFSFVSAPANSLADSAAMSMLGDEKHLYGRVRMGGTFGWALAAPLAGIVVARYGLSWAFWVYAFSMFVALLISQNFLYTEQKEESSFWQGLRVLLGNRQLMLFLFMAFICGTAFATVNNYLFAYMNQLHIDESRMGYALTIATAAEIPVLFFANRLLIRFKPRGLLILSMAATGVRLLLYALFDSLTGILVFQLLNGLTFPALWVAGVSYANDNAPAGLSATTQAVFGTMIFGFGAATGGFLGGILLEKLGGQMMYAIFGAMTLVMLVIYVFLEPRIAAQHEKAV